MAKQTINIGASPNDGTGTPLRTAFDYTNQNFTELYTAVGPSGNNIVVPGNATITGDLTVRTNKLAVTSTGVGCGTTTPALPFVVSNAGAQGFEINPNGSIVSGGIDILSYNRSTSVYKGVGFAAESYLFRVGTVSATDAMTLNSTGLGVGTSPSRKLSVSGAGGGFDVTDTTQSTRIRMRSSSASNFYIEALNSAESAYVTLRLNDTTQIDAAGNVGIGVTPSAWNSSYRGLQLGAGGAISAHTSASLPWLVATSNSFINSVGDWKFINNGYSTRYLARGDDGTQSWWTSNNGSAGGTVSYTQAMTLDASGNLLVGATAQVAAEKFQVNQTVTNAWAVTMRSVTRGWINRQSDANGGIAAYFEVGASNTNVGSITTTASATSYTSASDYRLKEAVQPLVGGLSRLSALKPSIYKWKVDGSNGEGFLAHELAEVVPLAVTGEKDAVNADGSIKPQGVDLSKVVPILVAAIQELTAEVNALKKA